MMLIVLDKNPILAAQLVPNNLKFKQLLELAQMICSCGYSNIYKKISQGKAIQEWIKKGRNKIWVKTYGLCLFYWCCENIKMSEKTINDISNILASMPSNCDLDLFIETAIFRYKKGYIGTTYATDTELPIVEAVREYKKYMEWKK